ncbi:Oidioi.mRNA.OKI2018_I69.XSR.g13279.t1.cds [Oikopleura dioica]|uniref:Oidioi.mRNA.OKI2018_I69.XSR.g13279.t1.cds n=1 Tax=Oikopleura dioica TaxID=34765 RepID=A0ABN7S6E6_OIKDI|nr:Oidioi.mRNA.OKI2018_I69.XSR.g13279.t1.cds [Oikopleura dioica]
MILKILIFVQLAQTLEQLPFKNATSTAKPRETPSLPADWRAESRVNISVAQPPRKRVKTLDRQAALIKRYRQNQKLRNSTFISEEQEDFLQAENSSVKILFHAFFLAFLLFL